MPGDPAPEWPLGPVRPACPPFDICTLERRRWDLLGRLGDLSDVLAWPAITTVASLLSPRLGRLARGWKDETAELDPVG